MLVTWYCWGDQWYKVKELKKCQNYFKMSNIISDIELYVTYYFYLSKYLKTINDLAQRLTISVLEENIRLIFSYNLKFDSFCMQFLERWMNRAMCQKETNQSSKQGQNKLPLQLLPFSARFEEHKKLNKSYTALRLLVLHCVPR